MINKTKLANKYNKKKVELQKKSRANREYYPLNYLPYPRIHQILKTRQVMDELSGASKGVFNKIICDNSINSGDIALAISKTGNNGSRFLKSIVQTIGGLNTPLEKMGYTERMVMFDALHYYRFSLNSGKLFEISDDLSSALMKTDIKGKCPIGYMKPPFSSIYLHFGSYEKNPILCANGCLEGAFINYGEINDPLNDAFINSTQKKLLDANFNVNEIKSFLEIKLVFTDGKNKRHCLSTSRSTETLYIDDENDTVENILEKNLKWIKLCRNKVDKDFYEDISRCIIHLAKALLYINTRNKKDLIEVSSASNEKSLIDDLNIRDEKLSSMIKRFISYNKIIINSKDEDMQEELSKSEKMNKSGVKPHWRRGHFRTLPPLPPNRPEEKLTWIKPTLVGSCKKNDAKESSYFATI